MPYEDTALTTMLHRHYLEPKVGDDPTTYCLLSNCSANVSYSGITEMKASSNLDFPTKLRRFHQTSISCLCFEPLASALELSYSLNALNGTDEWIRTSNFITLNDAPLPFGLHRLVAPAGFEPALFLLQRQMP